MRSHPRLALLALPTVLGLLMAGPAHACHVGGEGCGPPEAQPFDPQVSVTLSDHNPGAHPTVRLRWEHAAAHEQLVGNLDFHLPAGFDVDLDAPHADDELGTLSITIQGGIFPTPTTFEGDITDANDYEGYPSNGVYRWFAFVSAGGIDYPVYVFARHDPVDGHFHAWAEISDQLIQQAHDLGAYLVSASVRLKGIVATGGGFGSDILQRYVPLLHDIPFIQNPMEEGTYDGTTVFTAWDDPATPELPPTVERPFWLEIAPECPIVVDLFYVGECTGDGYLETWAEGVLELVG